MSGAAVRNIASAMTAAARPGAAQDVVRIDPIAHVRTDRLRTAAYARVSSSKEDQLNSYEAQMAYYTRYITGREDWQLVDIYADEGITGTSTKKRDDFHRLMRDCRKGKVDHIITKSVSRFCRNTLDCITAVRELTELGVSIHFEKEAIDTRAMRGELILTCMSDLAQNESLSTAGNLRRGIRMRMKLGTYVATSAPLGYRLEEMGLVVDEAEAQAVRWIFKQYLSGMGTDRIALFLTMTGIPRKDGDCEWSKSAVAYILTNERYLGDALYQKSYTSDTLPFRKIPNCGELDRYYYTDVHPPLIDRGDFERVRQLMEQRRWKKGQHTPPPLYPFSRKIVCGCCGRAYRYKVTSGKPYWVCRRHDRSADLCAGPRIPEPVLEAAFARMAGKLKLHSGILERMLEQLYEAKRSILLNNPQVMEMNEQIMRALEQNRILSDLAAKSLIDPALCISRKNENNARVQKLRVHKNRMADTELLDGAIEQTRDLLDVLQDAPRRPADFDADLFGGLVDRMVVEDAEHLVFRLHNGMELRETLKGGHGV